MSKFRAVLRRHWPLLAVTTLVGLVAGVVSAQLATSSEVDEVVYQASEVIIANPNSSANPLIPQDTLKVTRGEVAERAAEIFTESQGEATAAGSLAAKVSAESAADSKSLTISSNDVDPDLAAARVAAFSAAFLEVTNAELQADSRREFELLEDELLEARLSLVAFDEEHPELTDLVGSPVSNNAAISQLITERRDLQARINSIDAQVRQSELELTTIPPYETLGPERPRPAAETSLVSVPTSTPIRAGLLALLGLLVGGVVVMVIERMTRRIDTRDELVDVVDAPILAEIGLLPKKQRVTHRDGSLALEGVWAEPYRRVRSAIQFVQSNPGHDEPIGAHTNGASREVPRVFLITSTSPREGKSTTTALTADALAEVDETTLVVGGDFRRPEIDRLLGANRHPSLQDMATMDPDRARIEDVIQRIGDSSLYVVPSGEGTREVARLIEVAKEVAAIGREEGATVLFDSSPIQAANDVVDLLPVVDYVILVVRAGRTTESSLLEVVDTIQRMDTKILGIVFIGTRTSGRRQSYYYDYYAPADDQSDGRNGSAVNGSAAYRNGSSSAPAESEQAQPAH